MTSISPLIFSVRLRRDSERLTGSQDRESSVKHPLNLPDYGIRVKMHGADYVLISSARWDIRQPAEVNPNPSFRPLTDRSGDQITLPTDHIMIVQANYVSAGADSGLQPFRVDAIQPGQIDHPEADILLLRQFSRGVNGGT